MEVPDLGDPTQLTDEQRADLIRHALSDGDGVVTRWCVIVETATDTGFTIAYRDTGDPYWITAGLASWLHRSALSQADAED